MSKDIENQGLEGNRPKQSRSQIGDQGQRVLAEQDKNQITSIDNFSKPNWSNLSLEKMKDNQICKYSIFDKIKQLSLTTSDSASGEEKRINRTVFPSNIERTWEHDPLTELRESLIKILSESQLKHFPMELFLSLEQVLRNHFFFHFNFDLSSYHFCLAMTLDLQSNPNAGKEYRQAHQHNPKDPEVCLNLAFYHIRNNSEEALEYLRKVQIKEAMKERYIDTFQLNFQRQHHYFYKRRVLAQTNSHQIMTQKTYYETLNDMNINFLKEAISEGGNEHYYYQLADLLFLINKLDESRSILEKLKSLSISSQRIKAGMGFLFYKMNEFQEGVACCKQAIAICCEKKIAIHSDCLEACVFLIESLIVLKRFQEAKIYLIKFLIMKKYQSQFYYLFGRLFRTLQMHSSAIPWYILSALYNQKYEESYATREKNSKHISIELGQALIMIKKTEEAKAYIIQALQSHPISQLYSMLTMCFYRLEQKLSVFECYKRSINSDYMHFICYLSLADLALENSIFKVLINSFLDNLKQDNPQNQHIKFYVALYYYLSRQKNSEFQKFILQYLQQQEDSPFSNVVTNTLIKYQWFPNSIKQFRNIYSIIFGILNKAKGNRAQAHSCFTNLYNKFKAKGRENPSDYFTKMYEVEFVKVSKELRPHMLNFFTIQMLQENPKQALRCHYQSLNFAPYAGNDFQTEMQKLIKENLQRIDYLAAFLDQAGSDIYDETIRQANIPQTSIIHFSQLSMMMKKVREMVKQLKEMEEFPYSQSKFGQFLKVYFIRLDRGVLKFNEELLEGIARNRTVDEDNWYYEIQSQISREQQEFLQTLNNTARIYGSFKERKILLYAISPIIQSYFQGEFIVNQVIKLIFNDLQFYIIQNEQGQAELAEALFLFKNSPEYKLQNLKEDLQAIFKENFKNDANDEQSEMSMASFESFDSFDDIPIVRIEETTSQVDKTERSLDFDDFQAEGQVYHSRKGSDCNISDTSSLEFEQLLKDIRGNKNEAIKIIKAPIQQLFQPQKQPDDSSTPPSSFAQHMQIESLIQDIQSFRIAYSPSKIKFKNASKYLKFNQFLFLNTFHLIKYLSKNRGKEHIAKHACNQVEPTANESFNFDVEKGDRIYYPYNTNSEEQRTLKWIWHLGPSFVLQWIVDIGLAVTELEELGIYHADLTFRNTIKITEESGFVKFKVIDFDKAFKMVKTQKNDKAYECTRSLIDFWLRFSFDKQYPQDPYYDSDHSKFSSSDHKASSASTDYNEREIIDYMFHGADQAAVEQILQVKRNRLIFLKEPMNKCLSLFRKHMRESHLAQYVALVEKILDNQAYKLQNQRQLMEEGKLRIIKAILGMLKVKKMGYHQFVGIVQKISGKVGDNVDF